MTTTGSWNVGFGNMQNKIVLEILLDQLQIWFECCTHILDQKLICQSVGEARTVAVEGPLDDVLTPFKSYSSSVQSWIWTIMFMHDNSINVQISTLKITSCFPKVLIKVFLHLPQTSVFRLCPGTDSWGLLQLLAAFISFEPFVVQHFGQRALCLQSFRMLKGSPHY